MILLNLSKKRHMPFAALFLTAVLVLVQMTPVYAQGYEGQLRTTVDKVLAAYGGKENLLNVKTIAAHGGIEDFLRKTAGGYARTMRRPGELRIDIMPERGGEVRILSHGKGLQGSGRQLREASALSVSSMRYQYGYLDLPMSLADGSAKAAHVGMEELGGRPMEILHVELTDAPRLKVYIDFQTHLIRRVEANFDMGEMGSSVLGTEYDNFKIVDGVVFPLRLTNLAGGKSISVISITRFAINQPLPEGTFSAGH